MGATDTPERRRGRRSRTLSGFALVEIGRAVLRSGAAARSGAQRAQLARTEPRTRARGRVQCPLGWSELNGDPIRRSPPCAIQRLRLVFPGFVQLCAPSCAKCQRETVSSLAHREELSGRQSRGSPDSGAQLENGPEFAGGVCLDPLPEL